MTQPSSFLNPTGCRAAAVAALALLVLMSGCSSPRQRAPVEDRLPGGRVPAVVPANTPAAPGGTVAVVPESSAKTLPGAENAGKPGYYTVKPGDTLIRIGLETGQNWRDIQRWNELENPNVIEVGQVVRVAPPVADANGVVTRPVASGRIEARPLPGVPAAPASPVAPSAGVASAASGAAAIATAAVPVAAAPAAPRDPDEDLNWTWPAAGVVLANFDEAKNKGLSLAGKAGDPVIASADGRVVYAGSGLRGYGNLIIVKHNAVFLSAYAHNQTLLVKEDQVVRRGQKIAEMGSSDADRVQLHFEIRRQGKPVDPAKLLPPR